MRQHVETIWEGDVTKSNQALELLFLVDQIHFWAVTQHRNFVAEHLHNWLARMDKLNQAAGGDANKVQDPPRPPLFQSQVKFYYPEWQFVRKLAKCNVRSKSPGGEPRSVQTEVSAALRRAEDRRLAGSTQ
jgi:hypothetical protein